MDHWISSRDPETPERNAVMIGRLYEVEFGDGTEIEVGGTVAGRDPTERASKRPTLKDVRLTRPFFVLRALWRPPFRL
jgi:hypothetical protein